MRHTLALLVLLVPALGYSKPHHKAHHTHTSKVEKVRAESKMEDANESPTKAGKDSKDKVQKKKMKVVEKATHDKNAKKGESSKDAGKKPTETNVVDAVHHAEHHGEPSKSDLDRVHRSNVKEQAKKEASDTKKAESLLLTKVRAKGEVLDEEKSSGMRHTKKKTGPAPICKNTPVEIAKGDKVSTLELTMCDGTVIPSSVETLSTLAQPLSEQKGAEKRVDVRLVDRLQNLAAHFGKDGKPVRFEIVSGYRPQSKGSMHSHGRAMDIRIPAVSNEELVSYCKTMIDTGCGYYPNSSFVHVDARDPGAGHVAWIDASKPGESPKYVPSWPLPGDEQKQTMEEATQELPKSASVDESASPLPKEIR